MSGRVANVAGDTQTLRQLAALLEAGLPLTKSLSVLKPELERLQPKAKQAVAELVNVASNYGSSISASVEALADKIESQEKLLAAIEQASVTPKATARLIFWLPVASFLLAQAIGFNLVAAMLHSRVALTSVLIGCCLQWISHRIIKKMISRAASRATSLVGRFEELNLAVIMLSAGVPLRQVAIDLGETEIAQLIEISQRYGLRIGRLLSDYVRRKESRMRASIELELAALAVKLLVPIGLLSVPILAFFVIIPSSITLITN